MLTNLLFGKALGSKLNKIKTKGLSYGAWKNIIEDYRLGIDFVEYVKIVRFKIGNTVTQDDIWHPIYVKFEKKTVKFMEI
jgi:hypothetical protein